MLSDKLIKYLKKNGFWDDKEYPPYTEALDKLSKHLDFDLHKEFTDFYTYVEDGPEFKSVHFISLFQIPWFIIYSDYLGSLEYTERNFQFNDMIPLTSFEGEAGFFYRWEDNIVVFIELGVNLENYNNGVIDKKWDSFNDFLEWYFDVK